MQTRRAHKRQEPDEAVEHKDKVTKKIKGSAEVVDEKNRAVISHAARLPPIVWVCDEKYSWWPGKLRPYPPADNFATVSRFGNIKPKTVKVECTEDFLLPFEHLRKDEFRVQGIKSAYKVAFETAFNDASQAQLHDDDGLPSMDSLMVQITMQSPILKNTRAKPRSSTPIHSKPTIIHTPDESLTIPGEGVFALSDRLYYPARVIEFSQKTGKYKVLFATGHQHTLERTKFYTKYEQKFLTCPLGELKQPEINESYEDDKLRQHVQSIIPELYEIVRGRPDRASRASDFFKGTKERLALAQKVGPGAFDANEYAFIRRLLFAEFMPSLLKSKSRAGERKMLNGRHRQQHSRQENNTAAAFSPLNGPHDITRGLSEQRLDLFVTDVLVPETVTRLTMIYQGVEYDEAHQRVLNCDRDDSKDISWVDDIYSARESFLEGSSFRDTK